MIKKEREKLNLEREVLADIASSGFTSRGWSYVTKYSKKSIIHDGIEYVLCENEIVSSDPEDGGADHVVVFKRITKEGEKYFRFLYSDWDMDYNFDSDFPEDAVEVFPKVITKTIFE